MAAELYWPERFAACVVVPVYNHERAIADVVAAARAQHLPVILVDDGSESGCAAVLDALAAADEGVELLRLPENRGKGVAVLAGFRRALAAGFSHALQMDADGQHDPSAIPEALRLARQHPRALVAGVPRFDDSIPRARLYGRYVTHFFVALHTWSLGLRDALCGFRVYPLLESVALANRSAIARRMDFDIDIGVRLVWDGVPIESVSVAVSYPMDGVSHFDMLRDNLRISRVHTRLFCGMLLRAPLLLARRFAGWFRR